MGVAVCLGTTAAQDESIPKFGTTVVVPGGLRGVIYYIHSDTTKLPDFHKLKPRGTIYTSSLNVPSQDFKEGFPGVTKKFEWFAIDYTGRFWIENAGSYSFDLISDDGAILYIDDKMVVDNDGQHAAQDKIGSIDLTRGIHSMRVSYYQGPRFQVALVLKVQPPGQDWRIFSTDEFKPPSNPEKWPPDSSAH